MTTTATIMRTDVAHISVRDTMESAAQRMRQLDVGALPICDGDGRPVGIVTDRDIVVKCIALGHNPQTTTAGELAQGAGDLHTVDVATDLDAAIALMRNHQIRRLPVTDDGRLVGIVTEADIARAMPDPVVSEFVETVCAQNLPVTSNDQTPV
ncbi:CBS domain-containing protein [Nocardia fluminea]|uniref:CBS domain-containing protein n=1 Tax=Nocardia fluminea TaxID=134984 RepID=UPI00382CF65F